MPGGVAGERSDRIAPYADPRAIANTDVSDDPELARASA